MKEDWEFVESLHCRPGRKKPCTVLVYHYTAGGSTNGTVQWFQDKNSGVSAHFVIGRDGRIIQMVKLDDVAWHAGKSEWKDEKWVNYFSVGIEICNWGPIIRKSGNYYCGDKFKYKYTGDEPLEDSSKKYWEKYPDKQIESVIEITKSILKHFPTIVLSDIVGHEQIAPGRKTDPGPAFPWKVVKSELKKWLDGESGKEDANQTTIERKKDLNDEEFIRQIKKKSGDRKSNNFWFRQLCELLKSLFKKQ